MTELQTPNVDRHALLNSTASKLADQYTDRLALGWRHRTNRMQSPTLTFTDLLESDDRLLASVDALILLKKHAELYLQGMLSEPVRRADVFAISLYALASANEALLDACLDLTVAIPDLSDAIADAMVWAPASATWTRAFGRLQAQAKMHIAGLRFRDFPGMTEQTIAWLRSVEPNAGNIVALCRLLRLMGRIDLAPGLSRYLTHPQPEVRLAAASAIMAMAPDNNVQAALRVLAELTDGQAMPIREEAVQCAILHQGKLAPQFLGKLAQDDSATHLYLRALGWSGNIDAIPILIRYGVEDEHRRVAGASLSLITGSDPIRDGWRGTAPNISAADGNEGDAIPPSDPDGTLPWPDISAFESWWNTRSASFEEHRRYLAGRPITKDWLTSILTSGPLAWRTLAVEYLQHLTKRPLFPTHLPAASQRRLFSEFA